MHTPNKADENFAKLAAMFPNAVTETIDENGEVVRAIDKDVLMQEISTAVVDGAEERYQFTWPDKKKAVLAANSPIAKTLRPCRAESVDFDNTENLYIEGDNLDVLKLLQETYLGKVKMIYIDPPYLDRSGQFDEEGNRLVLNTESNGRFHTDWLNMIYPRLRLAKDLLTDDGVIFISIDDNEAANLVKVCSEIFGAECFVADIAWQRTYAPRNDSKGISSEKEHLVAFSRFSNWNPKKLPRTDEMNSKYKSPDNDPVLWRADNPCAPGAASHQGMVYAIQHPFNGKMLYPSNGAHWRYQQAEMFKIMSMWGDYELVDLHDEAQRATVCGVNADTVRKDVKGIVLKKDLSEARLYAEEVYKKGSWPIYYFTSGGEGGIAKKTYLNDENGKVVTNYWPYTEVGHTDEAKKELLSLFDGKAPFDTPKPTRLIERIINIYTNDDDYILDLFSGSATTANAVLQTNLKKDNSNRKFIMIQLPEEIENSEYRTVSDVGKERIRRAGAKIKEENPMTTAGLDTGFRVLKLDSTNMKDVYYNPDELTIETLMGPFKQDRADRYRRQDRL